MRSFADHLRQLHMVNVYVRVDVDYYNNKQVSGIFKT